MDIRTVQGQELAAHPGLGKHRGIQGGLRGGQRVPMRRLLAAQQGRTEAAIRLCCAASVVLSSSACL